MPSMDSAHSYSLTIGGVEFYSFVLTNTLRVVEAEGSQIDTLSVQVEDLGWSADPVEWEEIVLKVDGAPFFGGYLVKKTPTVSPARDRRQFTVNCESYMTLFAKTPRVTKSWANTAPQDIVSGLFTAAGITGFDLTTHVTNTPTPTLFTANKALLSEALDTLAAQLGALAGADWTWRTDASKKLWLGPAASDAAAFDIEDITTCDWSGSFPPNANPSVDTDATQIRNRITVTGGVNTSSHQTDNFTGDGTTVLFKLTRQPVRRVVQVTVDGVLKRFGWDWVDDFGATVDVLINFEAGTLRFPDALPPSVGQAISITYTYDIGISTVRSDAASYAYYGRWFDYEHEDRSITSQAEAEAAGDALLQAYAYGQTTGQFVVERFGLRAGQTVGIEFPLLDLTGDYIIRQVTTELLKGGLIRATVQFGGIYLRLSRVLGTGASRGAGSAYYTPSNPYSGSAVKSAHVQDYDTVGNGVFSPP